MVIRKIPFASRMSVSIGQNHTVHAIILRWKCSICGFESPGDYAHNTVLDRFVKPWLDHCEVEHNETLLMVCPATVTGTKFGTLSCVAEILYMDPDTHEHLFRVDK